jgi:hypothetical protein
MNLRIAETITRFQPEEIVEIMLGPEPSMLARSSQQQQQQQQQVRRPGAVESEMPGTMSS